MELDAESRVIYKVNCKECNIHYMKKSGGKRKKWLKGHQRDVTGTTHTTRATHTGQNEDETHEGFAGKPVTPLTLTRDMLGTSEVFF